ncbi:MAG: hypothetical protein EON96_17835 [Caulobacteraceae bacterium]|nr:MAG: hypothetical protein EON96_17835 [Caulobacteraceae bacterium]
MAKRTVRIDRLIPVLGGLVLVLGVLILWLVSRNGFGPGEPSPEERARDQVREILGRDARIRYTEEGRRGAVCGYVNHGGAVVAFVSRPTRLMLETDPLKIEFDQQQADLCPGFLKRPPAASAS